MPYIIIIVPRWQITVKTPNGDETGIKAFVSLSVTTGYKRPVDEAVIEMPLHSDVTLDIFPIGSDVEIMLGTKELGMAVKFAGTIKKLSPKLPLKITCEGADSDMLKNQMTKVWNGADWPGIVSDAAEKAGLEPEIGDYPCPETAPHRFRADGHTPAQIINRAKEATGWVGYVIPGTNRFYFGPRGTTPEAKEKVYLYRFALNTPQPGVDPKQMPNVISSNLNYKGHGKYKKVVVDLVDSNNVKPRARGEAVVDGFVEGDAVLKLGPFSANLSGGAADVRKAEDRAKEELMKQAASGFEGDLTAFGNPFVDPGDTILLEDNDFPERSGYAAVEEMVRTVNRRAGYTDKIKLAARVEI